MPRAAFRDQPLQSGSPDWVLHFAARCCQQHLFLYPLSQLALYRPCIECFSARCWSSSVRGSHVRVCWNGMRTSNIRCSSVRVCFFVLSGVNSRISPCTRARKREDELDRGCCRCAASSQGYRCFSTAVAAAVWTTDDVATDRVI